MSALPNDHCAEILVSVKAAAGSPQAAMLTVDQYEQLTKLVKEVEIACNAGDEAEANRVAKLIHDILREGPPSCE